MPIVTVEIVTRPGESSIPGLAAALADRMGTIFGSAAGGTWVKVRRLARENYAENGGTPAQTDPVFVSVLKVHESLPAAREVEAARLTAAVAEICDRRPENVHVIYGPAGAGRVAFGGVMRVD